jgi:predicted small lipoprotein YifL
MMKRLFIAIAMLAALTACGQSGDSVASGH